MTPNPTPALRRRFVPGAAAVAVLGGLVAGCGTSQHSSAAEAKGEVTVTNCGVEESFPSPAERLLVTGDGNMVAMVLALGAQDQIAGITSNEDSKDAQATAYGQDVVDGLHVVSNQYPTMENAIAAKPDVVISGWNYGFSEEKNFTPDGLKAHDIAPYVLSESCRQHDGARGTMPPWEALYADLDNLGRITGREEDADDVVADIKDRLEALEQAPQTTDAPTVFLFDSASKGIFTSGSFGAPQAIIEAAGAKNATEDVNDTWTEVSWERLVTSEPDFFVFVDYSGPSYRDKVTALESNPATKNLPAVKEQRYLNLPISVWTSSPLNIDAAEHLRMALESHDLVPETDIEPGHDLRPR